MKAWIIQPGLAPYRVPLFEAIAKHPDIDLTVVLQTERLPGHPWEFDFNNLPFAVLCVSGLKRRRDFESQVYFSPMLAWHFLRERPDVVVCNGFTLSTLILLPAMLLTRTPYVIWNEGTKHSDAATSPFKLRLRRWMARFADAFIIAGRLSREYTAGFLQDPTAGRFYLSYNSVDNTHFARPTDGGDTQRLAELRKRFARKNILFVGKLTGRKGIPQLLEAYRQLVAQPQHTDTGLILIGDGPLKADVSRFAHAHGLDRIYLEGFVSQDRISAYYAVADVFALLSISDPNPLVIFEALAAGLPIVCSYRAGNSADFIRDAENGYTVDPLDIDDVVAKLSRVLAGVDREHVAALSRELVAQASYDNSARAFSQAIIDCAPARATDP